ncbi:Major facilitator superfamily domain-containing protein [Cladobotryum mycophilum]|uniref:Major facilitator superfamily domain-containing protein n=1 Tax=Cladobotryum mycophilum TaxID=491253 RepID=A0ABR0S7S6_9HYPO
MTQSGNSRPPPGGRSRTSSSGSLHASAPIPTILTSSRRGSTHRYQTFPTVPPKTPVERSPGSIAFPEPIESDDEDSSEAEGEQDPTALPKRQLLLLAFLSLAEQTALNSIGPYLPEMVGNLPGIPEEDAGFYVGLLASAFALAQLSSNFLWGYASDVIGRKPVLLAGTFCLMCCFLVFGFCKRYWQVVLVHALMGLLNGNAATVPTVLGEMTDRSNQSKVFTYLPIVYSLGGITGPAAGGILAGTLSNRFSYLGPNLLAVVLLGASVIVVAIWFEETLDQDEPAPDIPNWVKKLFVIIGKILRIFTWVTRIFGRRAPQLNRSWSSRWPRPQSAEPLEDLGEELDKQTKIWREILNRTTIILLITYLIFQLANVSFNSLYPIFAAAPAPEGRELSPDQIGVTLSLSGTATIFFQGIIFQRLKARSGNLGMYRYSLLGLAVAMVLIPWVGYVTDKPLFGMFTGKWWLYMELGFVLIIKNICAVGGLSSVMLLITNSAPSNASLGTLNGLAQTLSAAGRSFGPFLSGALFTLAKGFHKGEAFSWTLFGGLAVLGWVGTMFIHGNGLESDDYDHVNEVNADEEQQQA